MIFKPKQRSNTMLRTILVTLSLTLATPAVAEPWLHNRTARGTVWAEVDFESISSFKSEGHVFVAAYMKFCDSDRKPNCYTPDGADEMIMIVPAAHCGEGKGKVRALLYKGEEIVNIFTKTWSKDIPSRGAQATWFLCRLAMQKATGSKGI